MSTLSEILHETLVGAIASMLIAISIAIYGKMKDKLAWSTTVVYALVAACCVLFLWGRIWPPAWKERVTDENIETKIRQWLDAFNVNSGKVNDEHAIFNYAVTKEGTPPTTVAIEKQHPHYITIISNITLNKDDQATYERLSDRDKTEFQMLMGA